MHRPEARDAPAARLEEAVAFGPARDGNTNAKGMPRGKTRVKPPAGEPARSDAPGGAYLRPSRGLFF